MRVSKNQIESHIMKLKLETATKSANAVITKLKNNNKDAVIAICDAQGELILLMKTDNAPYSSIQIAINKAYTAARTRVDSIEIGNKIRNKERGLDIQYWGDSKITGFGGGLVINYQSDILGGIGLSGLIETEDMEYATIGLNTILNDL